MEEMGSNPLFMPIPLEEVGVDGFRGMFSGPLLGGCEPPGGMFWLGEMPPFGPMLPGPGKRGLPWGPPGPPGPPGMFGLGTGNLELSPPCTPGVLGPGLGVRNLPVLSPGPTGFGFGVPGPPAPPPMPACCCGLGLAAGKLGLLASCTLEGVCGVRGPEEEAYLGGMLPAPPEESLMAEEGVPGPPRGVPGPQPLLS